MGILFQTKELGDAGETRFATKDDSVFPRLQWLITAFNVNSYLLCVI